MDTPIQFQTIPIDGYSASVRLKLSPQADFTIVALHGFTGSSEDFLPLQEIDGANAFNWICPDFMGHGGSANPGVLDPYALPNAMHLIDQSRQLAPDPENVILLGYSMGGRLALHYLQSAKPLPAILIGASPGLKTPEEAALRRDVDEEWIQMLEKGSLEAFCNAWERQPLIAPQTRLADPLNSRLASRRRANHPLGLANSLRACGTGALPGLWDRLTDMPPVTLLHGALDSKFATLASDMATVNPQFKPISIPGTGHAPHLENPAAVMARINSMADVIGGA